MKDIGRSSVQEIRNSVLLFNIRNRITNLNKNFLYILEDLSDEFSIPEDKFLRARKRVLDSGNDVIREIESSIQDLEVKIK